MGVYRITTRFDLNSEAEKRAADYLKSLKHGEGNRFVVDAVLARIDGGGDHALLDQIRRIFREEVKAVPVAPLEHEQAPQDDISVLDDLKLFG